MKGIMNWFTNKLAPGMQKVFSNPWIAAVASAMQKILPFILVGSVISIYNVFVRYIPSLPDLSFVNTFSFGMMSLIVAFMVTYFGMVELDHPKYTITAGLTSVTVFLMAANAEMALAGGSPIYIVTTETIFTTALIAMGGLGGTLPLNFLMLFKCKSKKLKTMGKICIGPSIFNINEPLVYGAPIVFNPLLMIPMWINSIIGPLIIWFVMKAGMLNIPAGVNNISRIPAPICTWLTTDDFRAFIWFLVLFIIYGLIWYPFLMRYDNQLVKEEHEKELLKKEF